MSTSFERPCRTPANLRHCSQDFVRFGGLHPGLFSYHPSGMAWLELITFQTLKRGANKHRACGARKGHLKRRRRQLPACGGALERARLYPV
jgi:hypothetical protein